MNTNNIFEEENNGEVFAEPVKEAPVDPVAAKKAKKAKVGLSVPAIIFAVIAAFLCLISWLVWSGAKDALNSGDAAEAVFGGIILIITYFAFSVASIIASIPSIILSIILLANRKLKSVALPIVVLVVCVGVVVSLILGYVLLGTN